MREVHSTCRRTLTHWPVEGGVDEEEASEEEGDRGDGLGDLIGNDDGENTAEGPSYMESVSIS